MRQILAGVHALDQDIGGNMKFGKLKEVTGKFVKEFDKSSVVA